MRTGTETILEKTFDYDPNTLQKQYELLRKQQHDIITSAIESFVKQEKEKEKKSCLRNTKLLLKHYPEFESHVYGAITCKQDLIQSDYYKELSEDEFDDILFSDIDEDVYIKSIQRSKSRTTLLLNNIDAQLRQLKKMCMQKGTIHKYHILYDYYVCGYQMDLIAEKYSCHKSQVSNWINEMTEVLSRLLFGIDSLNDLL